MLEIIKKFLKIHFSDPQLIALLAILLITGLLILNFGNTLLPVFLAIAAAYAIDSIGKLVQKQFSLDRNVANITVFTIIFSLFILFLVFTVPAILQQIYSLITELPSIVQNIEELALKLFEANQSLIPKETGQHIINDIKSFIFSFTNHQLTYFIDHFKGLGTIFFYLIIIPIMTFFLLLDTAKIQESVINILPTDRKLASSVFHDFVMQLNNYLKGKFFEFLIMAGITYLVFIFFNLNYSLILALVIGVSVLIPYLGIIVVTIPLIIVAYLQFDISSKFYWLLIIHLILQIFDGNVLVPLLFSKTNSISPFTIILAVLIFSSIWGFWGVVFAIPLATLFKAVLLAWKNSADENRRIYDEEHNHKFMS